MKYRLVDYEQQFAKYEILEIPVPRHGSVDPRPESVRPDQSRMRSIRKVGTSKNWAERRELIRPLIGATTTCELIAANKAVDYSQPAPSLGLVRVDDAQVRVTDGEPWEPNQLAKVIKAAQPDLFNPDGFRELQPAPFRVTIRYRCANSDCNGHQTRPAGPGNRPGRTAMVTREWTGTSQADASREVRVLVRRRHRHSHVRRQPSPTPHVVLCAWSLVSPDRASRSLRRHPVRLSSDLSVGDLQVLTPCAELVCDLMAVAVGVISFEAQQCDGTSVQQLGDVP